MSSAGSIPIPQRLAIPFIRVFLGYKNELILFIKWIATSENQFFGRNWFLRWIAILLEELQFTRLRENMSKVPCHCSIVLQKTQHWTEKWTEKSEEKKFLFEKRNTHLKENPSHTSKCHHALGVEDVAVAVAVDVSGQEGVQEAWMLVLLQIQSRVPHLQVLWMHWKLKDQKDYNLNYNPKFVRRLRTNTWTVRAI